MFLDMCSLVFKIIIKKKKTFDTKKNICNFLTTFFPNIHFYFSLYNCKDLEVIYNFVVIHFCCVYIDAFLFFKIIKKKSFDK
jgi:hypothetical protein